MLLPFKLTFYLSEKRISAECGLRDVRKLYCIFSQEELEFEVEIKEMGLVEQAFDAVTDWLQLRIWPEACDFWRNVLCHSLSKTV